MLRGWAAWQEGRAALAAGDTDDALALFSRAAEGPSPDGATEPIRRVGQLAIRVDDLRRRRKSHREAEAMLGHAEHQVLNESLASVRVVGRRDDGLLGTDGWSRAPAPLKQPGPSEVASSRDIWQAGAWERLRRALLPNRHSWDRCPSQDCQRRSQHQRFGAARVAWWRGQPPWHRRGTAAARRRPPRGGCLRGPACRGRRTGARCEPARSSPSTCSGRCASPSNDVPVEDWSSGRFRSLFGYLLTHRQPWPPREVLMDVFWPAVAAGGVEEQLERRHPRAAADAAQGNRRPSDRVRPAASTGIHPDLHLWLDVAELDRRVDRGRRLEADR